MSRTAIPQESLDIEELVSVARSVKKCAYYLNKEHQKTADIILMPYNYVLSNHMRSVMQIDIKDNILIIDEAHNIGKAAEDAVSFDLSTTQLKNIEKELI